MAIGTDRRERRVAQADRKRNQWWLVAAAGLAVFMASVDLTIVNVALPAIERDFEIATSMTEWIVLAYLLPLAGLALPSGRWLDSVGRRPALMFSLTGFALASVAAGLAPGLAWLIGARLAQGTFGALLFALVSALATTAVQPQARGRAMGLITTLGPLGLISASSSWRSDCACCRRARRCGCPIVRGSPSRCCSAPLSPRSCSPFPSRRARVQRG
jgi:predicted MFS family arabinose efflux permease